MSIKSDTLKQSGGSIRNGECICGRAPHGRCVGWHKLSEKEYEYLLRFIDLELLPMDKRFGAYKQREIAKHSPTNLCTSTCIKST